MAHYTKMLGAAVAMAAMLALGGTASAGVDTKATLKCQQTIAKELDKLVKGNSKTLQKCVESIIIKDKALGGDPGPGNRLDTCLNGAGDTLLTKTQEKVAKSLDKFQAGVEKACCGKDKICGGAGSADDCSLASLGFTGACPAAGAGCGSIVVQDPGSLADCLACVTEESVEGGVALAYDSLLDLDKDLAKDEQKCQATFGKEAMKYYQAKHKNLLKCWEARFKGKHGLQCPSDADGKTAEKIGKSELKFAAAVCKKCGGDGKACQTDISTSGGTQPGDTLADDFSAADIGAADPCPGLYADGASVTTIEEAVACVRDGLMDRVDCTSTLSVPSLSGGQPPKCVEPACIGNAGGSTFVDVDFSTTGAVPAGTQVVLTYDPQLVTIPGTAGEPSVTARVTDDITGDGGIVVNTQPNDEEVSLTVSQSDVIEYQGSNLFTVEFDTCGAAPVDSDFSCVVVAASDDGGNPIPSGTVTCSATVL